MERVAQNLLKRIENNEFAGATAIVLQQGKSIYSQALGYANMDKKDVIQNGTIFRLASMTKPIIAVAVLILVEQGKLKLTDPISKYLPEYTRMNVALIHDEMNKKSEEDSNQHMEVLEEQGIHYTVVPAESEITILHLLNHTSGLGMGLVSQHHATKSKMLDDTLDERIAKWSEMPLDFQPGTNTGYSGLFGFDILGKMIEIISNMDLQSFLYKHIFHPLHMVDTRFELSDEQIKRTATLYEAGDGQLTDVTDSDPLAMEVNANRHGYYSGAGGLFGTLSDYIRFVQMLANEGEIEGVRILQPESVLELRTIQLPHHMYAASGVSWGLGVRVIVDKHIAKTSLTNGSYGWSGAFGTHFWIDPQKELAVVLMMNLSNIGGAGSVVARELEETVYSCLYEDEDQPRTFDL